MLALISLQSCWLTLARRFANNVIETNAKKYAERGQENLSYIHSQIQQGRLAELAVAEYLSNLGYAVGSPDMGVYSARQKSFSADLVCEKTGTNFHVKSVSSENADRFGLSWSFQKEDGLLHHPTEKDLIVLCEMTQGGDALIHGIIPAQKVMGLYAEPVKESLRHTKRVLYWDSISSLAIGGEGQVC